jgi:hypothetical protein
MSFLGITASGSSNSPAPPPPPPPEGAYATGGFVTEIAGFKIHLFNSSDTFATTSIWPSGRTIEYLVVGGGGGGSSGGGGAGGFLTASGVTATASTNYAVIIGAGGTGSGSGTVGTNGGNSSLVGGAISATAVGGGGGGSTAPTNGATGGSGGGGGANIDTSTIGTGGLGTSGQGNAGGDGISSKFITLGGAGGGAGSAAVESSAGSGVTSLIYQVPAAGSYIADYEFGSPATAKNFVFTVASGQAFTPGQVVQITSNQVPYNVTKFGYVVSYSGTTLTISWIYGGNFGTSGSTAITNWFITYLFSGGGASQIPQNSSFDGNGSMGGSGGLYMTYASISVETIGTANSGGGAALDFSGRTLPQTGGSGKVIIKYAYP